MAETPQAKLHFRPGCPDCGDREVQLPLPLPDPGDDFDWAVRDYDGFRLFMLEELIARFPERRRWTPADMEVALVEVMAAVLDQLSDMLDRVAAEAFLETARRPESVRRLLAMIGYDAATLAGLSDDPPGAENAASAATKLHRLWARNPELMEAARRAGPRAIHSQHRMVTTDDYGERIEEHPLVERAQAETCWSGSWISIRVVVIAWNNLRLEESPPEATGDNEEPVKALRAALKKFNKQQGLVEIDWSHKPAVRTILRPYLDALRMAGQEVLLADAEEVGISMALSIRVAPSYFQSEVKREVEGVLGGDEGGFFESGRLDFGEDLHAGDIIQAVTALAGVEAVCLNRFKRVGRRFSDQSGAGRIVLQGTEVAVCRNEPDHPERGHFSLKLHGGRRG